jgi:hypothetical protein
MIIAVIGSGDGSAELLRLAERVGEELGRRGIMLVCGGGGGVMEAACRGSKSTGGATIGILPGHHPEDANRWVDIPICTGLGQGRNVIIAKTGRAAIAVGGRYGTLSEIGHALKAGTPVIGLHTWTIAREEELDPSIVVAHDPVDAVDKAVAAARARARPPGKD